MRQSGFEHDNMYITMLLADVPHQFKDRWDIARLGIINIHNRSTVSGHAMSTLIRQ